MPNPQKNGLLDEAKRWPGGIVPYHIEETEFGTFSPQAIIHAINRVSHLNIICLILMSLSTGTEEIAKIEAAIADYHAKTCIKFRPYVASDKNFIVFQSSKSGCWSSVGRQESGQVINLQNPGCLSHGTIIHEILHALGFYHEHSSSDRDDWVTIVWDNISRGK